MVSGAGGCTDAPLAPEGAGGVERLLLRPVFQVVATGSAAQDSLAVAAQRAAWDRLNRFRVVLKRVPSGVVVVVDTVIAVTPGQQEYALGIMVPVAGAQEQFSLELFGLQDDTPLFQARTQVTVSAGGGGAAPPPVPIAVQYAGPGVQAASVEVVPDGVVVRPGGQALLAVRVLDRNGTPIGGVPVAWVSEAAAVARVSAAGEVSGVAEGVARLLVATPTGVGDTVWVYVVRGEVAYATEGGDVVLAGLDGSGVTPVTVGAGGARAPAWSPDGSRLIYEAGGVVRDGGGGTLLPGRFPWFSPDGSKLVVEGTRIANADGSRGRDGPSGATPVWDVDGAHLIVGGGSIERVRADGTARVVLSSRSGDRWPVVSRGGRIAFVSERDGEAALYAMDGDGSGQRRVTPPGLVVRSRAAWSPNGRWLVVSAGRAGFPAELQIVAADGSAPPVVLPIEGSGELDPAWRGAGPGGGARGGKGAGTRPSAPGAGGAAPGLRLRLDPPRQRARSLSHGWRSGRGGGAQGDARLAAGGGTGTGGGW